MKATLDNTTVASKNGGTPEVTPQLEEALPNMMGIEKVFAALQPGAVFGEPVVTGNYTVITASEVAGGGGFGIARGHAPTVPEKPETTGDVMPGKPIDTNWVGGGGGGSNARPVALIVIGPDGVKVQPVMDVTRLALSGIATWRRMLPLLLKTSMANRRRKEK